jgi:hypothetical protein
MHTSSSQAFERLRYWQGQTLRSLDHRDQSRFDSRRRQLHNRALHRVDGVSFGLAVTQIGGPSQPIEVDCGLAYDCRGRELVIQRPRTVAAPASPSWLILRLRPAIARGSCCPSSDPGCIPGESLLLDEDMELTWTPLDSFEPVDGVALARFTAAGLDADFRPRPARPLARPRLARGQTVRGNTPWEPWTVDEPDGQGGIRKKVVGVQTRIDASAAGFTRTPSYLATLESPTWDVARTEFAPAFFPQVADPGVDGFTFRLLMLEIARRRYAAASGVSRVTSTSRAVGGRLQIVLASAAPFQKGDAVALLRPRARSIVRVEKASGVELTLAASLGDVVVDETVLAIGNLPRASRVTDVNPEDKTMVAEFKAAASVKKGDVLLRTADSALTVVDRVSKGKLLTVNKPFVNWQATDAVAVARHSAAMAALNPKVSADGLKMSIDVPSGHGLAANMKVALLAADKTPFVPPRRVVAVTAAKIDVEPPLAATELADLKKLALFAGDITIHIVQPKSPGTIVEVDSTAPFEEGDFVAADGDTSAITTVATISSKKKLVLNSSIPLKAGDDLVAANWYAATTVTAVGVPTPNAVVVARPNAAPVGSFVVRRIGNDFSDPAVVEQVGGTTLTLEGPIADLAPLDTLAVGVFPRIAEVIAPQPQEEQLLVEADKLTAGDSVVVVDAAPPAAVVQVVSVSGTTVVLNASLGTLSSGQKLAVVTFRDRALLTAVDAADPRSIEIDETIAFREHDVIGVLTHYADNSNPGFIDTVQGDTLTLLGAGTEHGDGIASGLDIGILGPAAVSYAPSLPFPLQFQPITRLLSVDGLTNFQRAVAFGFDLLTGRFVSSSVAPLLYDPAGGHVYLWPLDFNAPYRYRPETLSIITTFNTDFPRAFATFAEKQQLSVCWIGCQHEFPPAGGCPAQHPYELCAESGSTEA